MKRIRLICFLFSFVLFASFPSVTYASDMPQSESLLEEEVSTENSEQIESESEERFEESVDVLESSSDLLLEDLFIPDNVQYIFLYSSANSSTNNGNGNGNNKNNSSGDSSDSSNSTESTESTESSDVTDNSSSTSGDGFISGVDVDGQVKKGLFIPLDKLNFEQICLLILVLIELGRSILQIIGGRAWSK